MTLKIRLSRGLLDKEWKGKKMGLKIIKACEPIEVKQLIVCIYGAPGTGKTTMANSAKKPLLLDFDHGAYRAANRKDTVIINSWAEVDGFPLPHQSL